jgi:hypothetical protein
LAFGPCHCGVACEVDRECYVAVDALGPNDASAPVTGFFFPHHRGPSGADCRPGESLYDVRVGAKSDFCVVRILERIPTPGQHPLAPITQDRAALFE